MEGAFIGAIISKLSLVEVMMFGGLAYLSYFCSKQFKKIIGSIETIKDGSWASLKNNLKDAHRDCLRAEETKKPIPTCYLELFYDTYVYFMKYGRKDGQVEYWKRDIDRWTTRK